MATTFRADIVAAIVTILQAQATATPTLLRQVHSSRPGSLPELPAAWVGSRDENITHDSGTRTRSFDGLTVVVADGFSGEVEAQGDRLDQLVDALVDRFTEGVSAVPGTILELTAVRDAEVAFGTEPVTYYRAVEFRLGRTFVKEGRQ